MYAVVKISGKQYKVSEGDILEVDKLPNKVGDKIDLPEVLLLAEDSQVKIGQPILAEVKVSAKILEQFKGDKIRVARFKAKVRHRQVRGFRALLTKLQIEKITTTKNG